MKAMPKKTISTVVLFAITSIPTLSLAKAYWPQFRGPEGRSVAIDQSLPKSFGPNENVLWKTEIPEGHSSPAIWGDRIFLTAYEDLKLLMICIRRSDGSILWQNERPIKELQRYSHKDSSASAPTPCTDGERVAFMFGDYGLVASDMDGNLLWDKAFLPSSSDFGYGASPALVDGKLLINCDGGLRSGLLCLDFKTGEELWHAERPKTIISYSTPYVWPQGSRTEILQSGSASIASYDLSNGEAIWHVTDLPGFTCPSPVASDDKVYFGAWTTAHVTGSTRVASLFSEDDQLTPEQLASFPAFMDRFDKNKDGKIAPMEFPPSRAQDAFNFNDRDQSGYWEKKEIAPLFKNSGKSLRGRNVLVSISAGGKGDITKTHVNWKKRKALPYVASPLLYQDRLYYVKKGGYLTAIHPISGEPFFESEKIGVSGEYYASPIGVDGQILVASKEGIITLFKASDKFEIIKKIDMEESILSSPAIVDDNLYLRTSNHLWAFSD